MKISYIHMFICNRFLSQLNEQGSEVMQSSNEHSQKNSSTNVSVDFTYCIKHFIVQLMHADTNKIIKYLKVLQHVSDHRRSIIREPCTVLG